MLILVIVFVGLEYIRLLFFLCLFLERREGGGLDIWGLFFSFLVLRVLFDMCNFFGIDFLFL